MDRVLRAYLSALIKQGSLEVETASGTRFTVGDGSYEKLGLRFADKAAQTEFMLNPPLKFGELYTDGRIDMTRGTIYDLVVTAARNMPRIRGFFWVRLLERVQAITHRLSHRLGRNNNKRVARKNVAHHYDLDRRLYDLFLDCDMQYSCAYFEHEARRSRGAARQEAPYRRQAADRAVSACSTSAAAWAAWGSISRDRRRAGHGRHPVAGAARARREARRRAGLADSARSICRTIATSTSTFDRIVSVGMFEHVGAGHTTPFPQGRRLLKDDGVALIHAHRARRQAGRDQSVDRQIYFSGRLYSGLSEVLPAVEKAGLSVTDIEVSAAALRRDASKLGCDTFLAPQEAASSTTNVSAACGNSISPPANARSGTADRVFQNIQLAKKLARTP